MEEKVVQKKKRSLKITIIQWVFVLVCITTTSILLLCSRHLVSVIPPTLLSANTTTNVEMIERLVQEKIVIEEITSSSYTYDNVSPVTNSSHFFEQLVNIDTQDCYIASPIEVDLEDPPAIVIYSHGSNTTVIDNMDDQFMKDLRRYAETFTKGNYIFAASNQHGQNDGDPIATQDTIALYDYILDNYHTNEKVYLIGFSMGAQVTFNYALNDPQKVVAIALLAPADDPARFKVDMVRSMSDISMKIWHGDKDVNVQLFISEDLVKRFNSIGKKIDLQVLNGVDHWGVDVVLKDEILGFFNDITNIER